MELDNTKPTTDKLIFQPNFISFLHHFPSKLSEHFEERVKEEEEEFRGLRLKKIGKSSCKASHCRIWVQLSTSGLFCSVWAIQKELKRWGLIFLKVSSFSNKFHEGSLSWIVWEVNGFWNGKQSIVFSSKPGGFLVFSDALSILKVHKSSQKLDWVWLGSWFNILQLSWRFCEPKMTLSGVNCRR